MINLDGKKLSEKIQKNLISEVEELKKDGVTPKLAVVVVGDDQASKVYVRNKHRMAQKLGIETIDIRFPSNTTEGYLLNKINELNYDSSVNAILVQLPLPKHINESTIMNAISPAKDVDGFNSNNLGKLFANENSQTSEKNYPVPCTPTGIISLLDEYKISVAGKHVVIVGRSKIVGRPLSALMLNRDATVTVAHSKTKKLREITSSADILVSAVGKPNFISIDDVKPNAIVIDVGINRINGKLVGDVSQNVRNVASYLTPVPGGVGPMTIASLMQQTVKLAKNQNYKF